LNGSLATVSCSLKKRFYGNDCKKSEGRAEAEVQQPQAQSMPAVRAAEGFSAQVWHLSLMFSESGLEG
jgi:hypothetical protein